MSVTRPLMFFGPRNCQGTESNRLFPSITLCLSYIAMRSSAGVDCRSWAVAVWLAARAKHASAQYFGGDCNEDSGFDIGDAIFLLNYLFLPMSDTPACDDACDSNDDGLLNVADGVYTLEALFNMGPLPPVP